MTPEQDVLADLLAQVREPAEWLSAVKLRNELVHEYPLLPLQQFDRVSRAYGAIPFLLECASRGDRCIAERHLLA